MTEPTIRYLTNPSRTEVTFTDASGHDHHEITTGHTHTCIVLARVREQRQSLTNAAKAKALLHLKMARQQPDLKSQLAHKARYFWRVYLNNRWMMNHE